MKKKIILKRIKNLNRKLKKIENEIDEIKNLDNLKLNSEIEIYINTLIEGKIKEIQFLDRLI